METVILTLVGLIVSPSIGYMVGRRQEIDKHRLSKAYVCMEEIALLIQEIHSREKCLTEWFEDNFSYVTFQEAMYEFNRDKHSFYPSETESIEYLIEKRSELKQKIRSARIYLNSRDLDRIENYVNLGDLKYTSYGLGEIFMTRRYNAFFENLINRTNKYVRNKLYLKIKNRLPRMHEIDSSSRFVKFIQKFL